MPVQAKYQTFEAEDGVTQMNSDLKLVFLYFIIHKGGGVSVCVNMNLV